MDFGHMHSTGAQNKTFISNIVLLLGAFITQLACQLYRIRLYSTGFFLPLYRLYITGQKMYRYFRQ